MGLTSNVNNDLNKSIEDKKKTDFGKQQDEFNLDLERQQERKRKEKKS